MVDDPTSATLALLLDRVRGELDALMTIVGDMQTGLSPFLMNTTIHDAEAYRHAQNLDLVSQTLDSLSLVLKSAASDSRSRVAIDIPALAANVPLAALAARIRGDDPEAGIVHHEIDLF